MKIEDLDLEEQYDKTRRALAECIEDENELFLQEMGFPAKLVSCVDEWVRVKFDGKSKESFVIETNLGLCSPNGERFGYYCLQVDKNGNVVDDFLVFE